MNQESSQNRFENLSRPKRILLLGITTVFLLFVLEIAAWGTFHIVWRVTDRAYISEEYVESLNLFGSKTVFIFQEEYRAYYINGLKPNIKITSRTSWGTDVLGLPVNQASQVGRDLTVDGNTFRIFVFGGSTVMGTGSSTTLGAFLEDALNKEGGQSFEVITAGIDGSHSGQALTRLATETLHLWPDMVITFDGVNDQFWTSYIADYKPNTHLSARLTKRILERDSAINRPFVALNWPALDSFFRRFYIYQGILSVLHKLGVTIPSVYDVKDQAYFDEILEFKDANFNKQGADVYLENLRSISAISNIRGIRSMHVFQPTLATVLVERGSAARPEEWEVLNLRGLNNHLRPELRASISYEFYRYIRAEFARRTDAPESELQTWLDLSRFFDDVDDLRTIYKDAVHYHDHRTQEIAEKIAGHVRQQLSTE